MWWYEDDLNGDLGLLGFLCGLGDLGCCLTLGFVW
jgi:hypothetical protein